MNVNAIRDCEQMLRMKTVENDGESLVENSNKCSKDDKEKNVDGCDPVIKDMSDNSGYDYDITAAHVAHVTREGREKSTTENINIAIMATTNSGKGHQHLLVWHCCILSKNPIDYFLYVLALFFQRLPLYILH